MAIVDATTYGVEAEWVPRNTPLWGKSCRTLLVSDEVAVDNSTLFPHRHLCCCLVRFRPVGLVRISILGGDRRGLPWDEAGGIPRRRIDNPDSSMKPQYGCSGTSLDGTLPGVR